MIRASVLTTISFSSSKPFRFSLSAKMMNFSNDDSCPGHANTLRNSRDLYDADEGSLTLVLFKPSSCSPKTSPAYSPTVLLLLGIPWSPLDTELDNFNCLTHLILRIILLSKAVHKRCTWMVCVLWISYCQTAQHLRKEIGMNNLLS